MDAQADQFWYSGNPTLRPTMAMKKVNMRKVPVMSHAEHMVHLALSVIEEEGLIAFFRAIRDREERTPLVDLVNQELDNGFGIEEMFSYNASILDVTENAAIVFEVQWITEERCGIRFGLMEMDGPGTEWYLSFDEHGNVVDLEFEEQWSPEMAMEAELWRLN
ncbi:MAG TPA: hypothetical protein PK760_13220 [Flavobacteriales bacterium]|nr:hypothetical protein [Flavobacteriales bacterium]